MDTTKIKKFAKGRFDEIAILGTLVKIKLDSNAALTPDDEAVLNAIKHSTNSLHNADLDTVKDYVHGLDEGQIAGVVSNTKGILHEMEFTHDLNHHGVHAQMFEKTNNPDYDITLKDHNSEHLLQIKATDDAASVKEWIAQHPHGEIAVTDELAKQMNLESTGISNHELTVKVDHFVDKMLSLPDDHALWHHFPILTVASMSIVIYELLKRYKRGEISKSEFKKKAAVVAGKKILKIGIITTLMMIPVVNVITGAALIAMVLFYAKDVFALKVNQTKIYNLINRKQEPDFSGENV